MISIFEMRELVSEMAGGEDSSAPRTSRMSSASAPALVPLYGLVAEFTTPEELLEATCQARCASYRCLEAYTPFPVEGLGEALGFHHSLLPLLVLLGGIAGGVGGYVPRFALVTRDRFFLCIEARDPKFDRVETRRFPEGLAAYEVAEVEM